MDRKDIIEKKMMAYIPYKGGEFTWESMNSKEVTLIQIRDFLIANGTILEEDLEQNLYIASFRTGFLKLATAVVGIQMIERTCLVGVYSKEGIIKQGLSRSVINAISEYLGETNEI